MIIFGALTAWLKKPLIIFATSLVGGYLVIKVNILIINFIYIIFLGNKLICWKVT